jgi:MFS family permease
VLGGVITDVLSWHWIFFVNLPVGAVALLFLAIGLRHKQRRVRRRIDYGGAGLLAAATTGFLLILTLGGSRYPWASPEIGGLAALTAIFTLACAAQEARAPEPVLPLHLFGNRVVLISWIVLTLGFMGLLGAGVFFPLFFQLVLGIAPSHSGLLTGPLMLGIVVSSIIGGRLLSATGRYKRLPMLGLTLACAAFLALGWGAATARGLGVIEPAMIALGLGLGLVTPNLTVAIQNAVEHTDLGAATATSAFFRSLGGALGAAGAGAILTAQLQGSAAADFAARQLLPGAERVQGLAPDGGEAVISVYRQAIATTFFAGAAVTLLALAVIFLLPELPLRSARAKG